MSGIHFGPKHLLLAVAVVLLIVCLAFILPYTYKQEGSPDAAAEKGPAPGQAPPVAGQAPLVAPEAEAQQPVGRAGVPLPPGADVQKQGSLVATVIPAENATQ